MKKIKRAIQEATVLAILLLIVGCAGQQAAAPAQEAEPTAAPVAESVPSEPSTIVLSTIGNPPSFDPLGATNVHVDEAAINLYNTLVQVQPGTDELEMELAESMEVSDDGLSYTFKLRKGVKFHDGSELTAEDVRYTVERLVTLKKGVYRNLSAISGAEVIDDYTVVLKLDVPFPPLPGALTRLYIVNADLVKENEEEGDMGEAWLVDHDAGSGPYVFVSWQRESEYVMEKFPDYFKGWSGKHADRVVWRIIKEATAAQLALEQGDVDYTRAVNPDTFLDLKEQPGIVANADPTLKQFYIAFNTQSEYLQDPRIRKALSLVYDYQGYVDQGMQGLAEVARGPLPRVIPCFDEAIPPSETNIEEAKRLMAEAGYPDGGIELEMAYQDTTLDEPTVLQVMQAGAAELGITIRPQAMEWGTKVELFSSADTALDLATVWAIPGYADPDQILYTLGHSDNIGGGGINFAYYSNPRMDELLDTARSEVDEAKRCELYKEAQQIWNEDVPYANVTIGYALTASRDRLKGYVYLPQHHLAPLAYLMHVEDEPDK